MSMLKARLYTDSGYRHFMAYQREGEDGRGGWRVFIPNRQDYPVIVTREGHAYQLKMDMLEGSERVGIYVETSLYEVGKFADAFQWDDGAGGNIGVPEEET